jgi:nitric oxide reductase activation protein
MSASGPKQSSPSAMPQSDPQFVQQERRDEPVIPADIERRMAKERAKNRYQSIKRDSEKLLELATELKQYVDKSGESVLSMDVVKKCDEIEKLSKSVRAKMKGE